MKSCILFFTLLLTGYLAIGQSVYADSATLIKYEPGFSFTPGIYLSFRDWKNDAPITKDKIVTTLDTSSFYFFEEILRENWITFYDKNGALLKVKRENIFGYSIDNIIYSEKNYRIPIIGAICHYSNIIIVSSSIVTGPGYIPSSYRNIEDVSQYIIDFETGKKMDFNNRNLESIIKRDATLFKSYKAYKGSKRDKLYIFLKRYNEAHPIYFRLAN